MQVLVQGHRVLLLVDSAVLVSLPLEDEQLTGLSHVLLQLLADDDSQEFFVLGLLHRDDLVLLTSLRYRDLHGDLEVVQLLVGVYVEEPDLVLVAHQEGVDALHGQPPGAAEVLFHDVDSDVVLALAAVNVEALLVELVSDALLDVGAEHHLRTVQVVLHNVLQDGVEGLRVDEVEVDPLGGRHLDTDVALRVKDEAADVHLVVLLPYSLFCQLVFL
mmetsp:Transcript_11928/g.18404  ORF Transcript_11928/g.18404 Transcript_11928/m.18404 type:complete len:217 (+) Transcript_11928:235-885(+)